MGRRRLRTAARLLPLLAAVCWCRARGDGLQHDSGDFQQIEASCALRLVVPTRPVQVTQGGLADLRGVRLARTGEDQQPWGMLGAGQEEALVSIDIWVDMGMLDLAPGYEDIPGEGFYNGPAPRVHLEGLRSTVNIALHGLRYISDEEDAPVDITVVIMARVIDDGGDGECESASALSMTGSLYVQVREKPFDPIATISGRPMGMGNILKAIGGGKFISLGNVSIKAIGQQSKFVSVDMFATAGQIHPRPDQGANIAKPEDGIRDTLRLDGVLSEVNAMIAQCVYKPPTEYHEWDRIFIIVRYGAHSVRTSRTQWPNEVTRVIPVQIVRPPRPPTMYWDSSGTSKLTLALGVADLASFLRLPELYIKGGRLDPSWDGPVSSYQLMMHTDEGGFALGPGRTAVPDEQNLILNGSINELEKAIQQVWYRAPPRLCLLQAQLATSSIDRVVISLVGTDLDQGTFTNESILLSLERDHTWWSVVYSLVNRSLVTNEDESASIGDLLNKTEILQFDGNLSLVLSAQHGQIWHMGDPKSSSVDQHYTSMNATSLVSLSSQLWYSPPLHFHGLDYLNLKLNELNVEVAVRVLSVNDPPTIHLPLSEASYDWYLHAIVFLPSLIIEDPDTNDLLTVRVTSVNVSLSTADPIKFIPYGVGVTSDSAVVELTATLDRLQQVFASKFIRVVTEPCDKESSIACPGTIEVCIRDMEGATNCLSLDLPSHPMYFTLNRITIPQNNQIQINASDSISLADLFTLVEREVSALELTLELTVSTGFLRYEDSKCSEWFRLPSSGRLYQARYLVISPDLECLNTALASTTFQANPDTSGLVQLTMTLFVNETYKVLNDSITFSVLPAIKPRLIDKVRITSKVASTRARVGDILNLDSLFGVQRNQSAIGSDFDPLELLYLSVMCKGCSWAYDRLVPRVSYEFAQLPSSNLTFMAPILAIEELVASLKFNLDLIPNSNEKVENIVVRVREYGGVDTLNSSIVPVIVDEDPLRWDVKQPYLYIKRKNRQPLLEDARVVGKTSDKTSPVHLSIKCMNSSVIVGIPNGDGELLEQCRPNNRTIELVSSRSDINRVLSSITVGLPARSDADVTIIELSATMPREANDLVSIVLVRVRWVGLKPPLVVCRKDVNCSVHAVEGDATPLGTILVVNGGEVNERHHRLLTVKLSVRNGTLVLPMHVYRVEVPNNTVSSEIEISGDAKALTTALEETLYTSSEGFTGEDRLVISVSDYGDREKTNNCTTNVVITVASADNERDDNRHIYSLTEGSWSEQWPNDAVRVVGDWVGDWEAVSKLMPPYFPELDIAENDNSPDEQPEDGFEAESHDDNSVEKSPLVFPLVHIQGTSEDPLSTNTWEDPTFTVDVATFVPIAGVSLISLDPISSDEKSSANVTLTISAIYGLITLSATIDTETNMVDVDHPDGSKNSIILSGPMSAVNTTLTYAQYRCGYECPLKDTIMITVWRFNERYRYEHQRVIHINLIEPLPVPRVILHQQFVYINEEDTLFTFENITLDGTPSQKAMAVFDLNNQITDEDWNNELTAWPADATDAWILLTAPAARSYTLDISVSIGFVFCTFEIAGCKNENKTQSSSQSLDGAYGELLAALTSLVYRPPVNWNSELGYMGQVVEWSFRVSDGTRVNETYVDMIVLPRVDPPVIHVPSVVEDNWSFTSDHFSRSRLECIPISIFEDLPYQFDGLSVRATDKINRDELSLFRVTLQVQHGTLSADGTLHCVNRLSGMGHLSSFTLTASLECVNQILHALTFTSDPHFSGYDALEIRIDTVTPGQPQTFDSVTIPLIVIEVNDAPYIIMTSHNFYECKEDVGCAITDLSLEDPDISENGMVTIIIQVAHGSVSLLYQDDSIVEVDRSAARGMSMTVVGQLSQLNRIVSGIIFASAPDWNSLKSSADGDNFDTDDYFDTIHITASDSAAFNASTISTFRIYVAPTPDPVVLHPPGNVRISPFDDEGVLRGDEDCEISIHGLAFSSVDETDYSTLYVSLSVHHGRLVLPAMNGASFPKGEDPGAGGSTLSIFGAFVNVNRSVAFIRYLPDPNYFGDDTLEVRVHAVDEYTKQPTPEASMEVPIVLDAVNDAPEWSVLNPSIPAQLDTPTLMAGISLNDIDFEGVDCEVISCVMDVTVEVSHGFVMLPKLSNPARFSTSTDVVSDGSTTERYNFLVISGTQEDLNDALSEIIFELQSAEFYRADNPLRSIVSVSLQVDDRGNYGKGGPQISTTTLHVRPIAWTTHGLKLTVPETVVQIAENYMHIFNGSIHILDVDAPHSQFSILEIRVNCNNGRFKLRPNIRGVQLLRMEQHSIKARGFVESLNEALNGSTYTPDPNWFGAEAINVYVIDTSLNSQRSVEVEIFLFVAPTNNQPTDGDNTLLPTIFSQVHTDNWSSQFIPISSAVQPSNQPLATQVSQSALNPVGAFANQVVVGTFSENRVDNSLPAFDDERIESVSLDDLSTRMLELEDDSLVIHLPSETLVRVSENSSILLRGVQPFTPDQRSQTDSKWSLMRACPTCSESLSRFTVVESFTGLPENAISFLTPLDGGSLIFSAAHPQLGTELWRSDGTYAGTVLVKDIMVGSGSSSPRDLTKFSRDGRVYFSASGVDTSWMLDDDRYDACQGFFQSRFNPNAYYAVSQTSVWDPDETYDCPVGFHWASTAEANSIFIGKDMLGNSEDLAYFDKCGWKGYLWGGQERFYFRLSDSKVTGAYKHAGYRDSYHAETGFDTSNFAGIMCIRDPQNRLRPLGRQLWSTDGTTEGTRRITNIVSGDMGAMPSALMEHGGKLYFQASTPDYGAELWLTDGSRDGTMLVADIEPGVRGSSPEHLVSMGDRILFSAYTEAIGRELWFSDGAPTNDYAQHDHSRVGTGLVLDICAGPDSSDPSFLVSLSSQLAIFRANDCVHGLELWISDGTRQGTTLLADIRSGTGGSNPCYLTGFSGRVFFQADDGIHGSEMWVTDGTSAGTTLLLDLAPGVRGSSPRYLNIFDSNRLLFAARADQTSREEFWLSDGTAAGTTRVFTGSNEPAIIGNDEKFGSMIASMSSNAFFYIGQDFGRDSRTSLGETESHPFRSLLLSSSTRADQTRLFSLGLECKKGWLSLGRLCDGVIFMRELTSDSKQQKITMEGTISALNCVVQEVTYNSIPEYVGWDELVVSLEELTASRVPKSFRSPTIGRLPIQIISINNPPIVAIGARYYAPVGMWVSLGGVGVSDSDAADGLLYLHITVQRGALRILPEMLKNSEVFVLSAGASSLEIDAPIETEQQGLRTLEFSGTVTNLDDIMNHLQYACREVPGCQGGLQDVITVSVNDNGFSGEGGPQLSAATAAIFVLN